MYSTIIVSPTTCYRFDTIINGQYTQIHDAEINVRSDNLNIQVKVDKNIPWGNATEISNKKANELYILLETTAREWLKQFPVAKE